MIPYKEPVQEASKAEEPKAQSVPFDDDHQESHMGDSHDVHPV